MINFSCFLHVFCCCCCCCCGSLYFECVDFVVSAGGAVHTLFVDCVPTVAEIVVVVVVVVVTVVADVVAVVDLR